MPLRVILANFDLNNLPKVIDDANKRVAENERRRFADTVANWSDENKPSFTRKISKSYGDINDYEITTDSQIYLWVDEGTEDHEIEPKGDYPLRIRGGKAYNDGLGKGSAYSPKTSDQKLYSDGSGEYYKGDAYKESVTQSIKPRNFTKKIVEKAPERWERALTTEIRNYIKRNIR